jgi:enamine deaminase RidA (YjgF/YER057c/UK114 family)
VVAELPGLTEIFVDQNGGPIPIGSRVGDLVHGFRIVGTDPATGELGDGIEAQLKNAYANMRRCVESAGGTTANIAHVSMYWANFQRDREAMNPSWVEMFPDETDRPTYKFMPADLADGLLILMQFFAVLGQRRRVLNVEGVAHTNPIPLGVRIGRYLFSSRVLPYDPSTGQAVNGAEAQAEFVFQNTTALLKAGEMSWPDVRQGRAFIADPAHQPLVDSRWEAIFPNAATRPVLHTSRYGGGPLQVMLEIFAALDDRTPAGGT